jgi:hypothetical protein
MGMVCPRAPAIAWLLWCQRTCTQRSVHWSLQRSAMGPRTLRGCRVCTQLLGKPQWDECLQYGHHCLQCGHPNLTHACLPPGVCAPSLRAAGKSFTGKSFSSAVNRHGSALGEAQGALAYR